MDCSRLSVHLKKCLPLLLAALLIVGCQGAKPKEKVDPAKKDGKKVDAAQSGLPAPAPTAEVKKPDPTPPAKPPAPTIDPDQGARALAKLWNEIAPPAIVSLLETWKDPDAARVLGFMDSDKAASVLAALPPKRGATISQLIEKQASIVKQEGAL